nr:MAG TPA: hypothetical protein [Caudoviricetes sp.]
METITVIMIFLGVQIIDFFTKNFVLLDLGSFIGIHDLHPLNPGGNHIRRVGIKHIGESSNGSSVTVPVVLHIKSAHVPSDTMKFFIRQREQLLTQNHGFFAVAGKKCGVIVFPCFITGLVVVVHFAKIMEHTHNIGAFRFFPLQFKPFRHKQKGVHDFKGMIKQSAGVGSMMMNGSRGLEEAPFYQFPNSAVGNTASINGRFHCVQKSFKAFTIIHFSPILSVKPFDHRITGEAFFPHIPRIGYGAVCFAHIPVLITGQPGTGNINCSGGGTLEE